MAIHFQPPIYHNLLVEHIDTTSKRKLIVFRSDNNLIINQEKLKSFTDQQLSSLLQVNESTPTSGLSDDDLFLACKSRRIQSPSELKKWSDFLSDMQEHIAKHSKKLDKSDKVDTDKDNTK